MTISVIHPTLEEEYNNYFYLRWEVLRKPWGEPKIIAPIDGDDTAIHFMAIDEDRNALAICRLQFNSTTEAQVRFVAVSKLAQEKGVGKTIMNAAEKYAKGSGATKMILHARENALPFYKKLDYTLIKKTHLLFNEIQHYLMEREL